MLRVNKLRRDMFKMLNELDLCEDQIKNETDDEKIEVLKEKKKLLDISLREMSDYGY